MSSNEKQADNNAQFIFDGTKPSVDDYGTSNYKFMPGDKVNICVFGSRSREGPYTIQATENGKYTLCDEYGVPVKNGAAFEEKDLVLYDDFGAGG